MKSKPNTRLRNEAKATAEALIEDLNAVRSVVMSKQRDLSPEDYASLERRLFESWVIEKIAVAECQIAQILADFTAWSEAQKIMRKELVRLVKAVEKLSRK